MDKLFGLPMCLHSAHPHGTPSRLEGERLPCTQAARKQSARNYRAESLHHECAVNGEPGQMIEIAVIPIFGKPDEFLPQLCDVLSSHGTHGKNFRTARVETSSAKELLHLKLHLRQPARLDCIGFGDDRQAGADSKQTADGQMLNCLWFDAFLCRDHQQHSSDAPSPGEHIVNKQAVAGHIDKADSEGVAIGSRSIEKGEAQIDGDAAPLLFRQTIRIDTSKRANKGGLAVIDVTCRSDNN